DAVARLDLTLTQQRGSHYFKIRLMSLARRAGGDVRLETRHLVGRWWEVAPARELFVADIGFAVEGVTRHGQPLLPADRARGTARGHGSAPCALRYPICRGCALPRRRSVRRPRAAPARRDVGARVGARWRAPDRFRRVARRGRCWLALPPQPASSTIRRA